MSKGVNKAILIGRLGADPEIKYTKSGAAVANISLATDYPIKNQDTGEWQEATEWHRVVFFERMAEVIEQYLRKGSHIYVEGSIRTEKWQDNDGQDRYTTKIYGRDMQMLGGRGDNQQPSTPAASRQGGHNPPPVTPRDMPTPPADDEFKDDVPF